MHINQETATLYVDFMTKIHHRIHKSVQMLVNFIWSIILMAQHSIKWQLPKLCARFHASNNFSFFWNDDYGNWCVRGWWNKRSELTKMQSTKWDKFFKWKLQHETSIKCDGPMATTEITVDHGHTFTWE